MTVPTNNDGEMGELEGLLGSLDVDFGYAVGNLNMDTTPESRQQIMAAVSAQRLKWEAASYETGYREGGSSVNADLQCAFDEELGLAVNGPVDAVDKVKALKLRWEQRAVRKYEIEQAIERLDVQCGEGTNCTNCNSKLPRLKELQAELATLSKEETRE